MIIAWSISQMCLALLVKGVPGWLGIILILINCICAVAAAISWEVTKSKIRTLEKSQGLEEKK